MSDAYKRYRRGDPDTSRRAAESVDLTKRQIAVLHVIADHDPEPLTGKEVAAITGYDDWKRMNELRDTGFVVVVREKRNRSGRMAEAYVLTQKGRVFTGRQPRLL